MPTNLSFAKIVAPPTETAWSQVYHAGNLFAVVAVVSPKDNPELNSIGKELFNALESEFFSLEEKSLPKIREAIEQSLKDVPEGLEITFSLAYSKEAILYLFLKGEGEIIMKRGEKVGVLLSGKGKAADEIHAASGFLKHNDVLFLETPGFTSLIPPHSRQEALERHLPNDMAERFSTEMADATGDVAALILEYQGTTSPSLSEVETPHEQEAALPESPKSPQPPQKEADETTEEAAEDEKEEPVEAGVKQHVAPIINEPAISREQKTLETQAVTSAEAPTKRRFGLPVVTSVTSRLPSKRVIFGAVAVVILVVLIAAAFMTKQHVGNTENQSLYNQIHTQAQEKYDEGQSLETLNAGLAQDDYKKAAQIIKDGLPKIKKGSDEEKKLNDLLSQIESKITKTESGTSVALTAVDSSESDLLSYELKNNYPYVTSSENTLYGINDKAVFKGTDAVIKNDKDWSTLGGFAVYNGNIYVLDKSAGLLKYTAGSDGYGKSTYSFDTKPTFGSVVSMAIDSSIWLLSSDGSVKKYTKGADDSLSLKSLPSPLSSPTRIFTTPDTTAVYILDNGNSRIIQLTKDGAFQKAYSAPQLKDATDLDVQEKAKKIYLLIGSKLYKLSL